MNVVITCLFNSFPDPQSGQTWEPDVARLTVLDSVREHGHHAIVVHDCLTEPNRDDVTFVKVTNKVSNAYFARWHHVAALLRRRSDIDYVWCVDGGDVTMLNDPFPYMHDGIIYVGSEPPPDSKHDARSVGFWWMRQLHPERADWIDANADRVLLNAGIVGGSRKTVQTFAAAMAKTWPTDDKTDMAAFNELVYGPDWVGRFVTGPHVHTPFWSFRTADPFAWWAHK